MSTLILTLNQIKQKIENDENLNISKSTNTYRMRNYLHFIFEFGLYE